MRPIGLEGGAVTAQRGQSLISTIALLSNALIANILASQQLITMLYIPHTGILFFNHLRKNEFYQRLYY